MKRTKLLAESRVLSIQSHPVHGYVGQKACTFPLQLLGVEVDPLNSVQLSNHNGYPNGAKGQVLQGEQLLQLVDGLADNHLLSHYTHVLTGYIGSVSFLRAVLATVRRLRETNPGLVYCLDPVLGDGGRFYAPRDLVPVYRDEALALATVITPNQFEMEQITGREIACEADAWLACEFAHDKGVETVVITSCLATKTKVMLLASTTTTTSTKRQRFVVEIPWVDGNFGGTGDLMAGLLLAWTSRSEDFSRALELACATVHAVILRTHEACERGENKHSELRLIQSQQDITSPPVERFGMRAVERT